MSYDYDKAPTDPRHGGKMTAEQAAERIAELEDAMRDIKQWLGVPPKEGWQQSDINVVRERIAQELGE